eukprot:scaffold128830_cov41-Attheya_sp.AAC.2
MRWCFYHQNRDSFHMDGCQHRLWRQDEEDGDGGDDGNNDEYMLSVSAEGGSSECNDDSSGINYWPQRSSDGDWAVATR